MQPESGDLQRTPQEPSNHESDAAPLETPPEPVPAGEPKPQKNLGMIAIKMIVLVALVFLLYLLHPLTRGRDIPWAQMGLIAAIASVAGVLLAIWERLSPAQWSWTRSFFILLLATVAVTWLTVKMPPASAPAPAPVKDVNVIMPVLADKMAKKARETGIELDYSPASVERLERILGELHLAHAAGRLPEQDLTNAVLGYGAYLGEVIRRLKNGRWEENHPMAGKGSFPLYWDGNTSFPLASVNARIISGEQENVWAKFRAAVLGEGRSPTTATAPAPEPAE